MQFKRLNENCIKKELLSVGFDKAYLDSGIKKHKFLSVKICGLSPVQATVIKQAAISKGADAAVHREVLTHKIEKSDLILSGSIAQLENTAKSLQEQPFKLDEAAAGIKSMLIEPEYTPLIMGILNVTEDSFSDGGKYLNPDDAINHAKEMIELGAQIIDIGAESTRPGAKAVPPGTEIQRLTPVVRELKTNGAKISIDTRNSKTAHAMLELGADIINDVSGLEYDKYMVDVIKNSNAKIIVMHSRGTPETMDNLNNYKNMTDDIFNSLYQKIELLQDLNIQKKRIIIDSGFGFAKNIDQNFELLRKIREFNSLGVKTLAGISRKRFLKSLIGAKDIQAENVIEELDLLTVLSSFYLFQSRVDIIRVHNVRNAKLALNFYKRLAHAQKFKQTS